MSLPAENVDVTSERDQLGMSWSRNPGHVAHRDDTSQARGHRAAQAPCGTPLGTLSFFFCEGWDTSGSGACPSGSGLLLWALLSRVSLAVEEGPLAQTGGRHVVKQGPWHGWASPYGEVSQGWRDSGAGWGLWFLFLTSSRPLHSAQQQIWQEDMEGLSQGVLFRR